MLGRKTGVGEVKEGCLENETWSCTVLDVSFGVTNEKCSQHTHEAWSLVKER